MKSSKAFSLIELILVLAIIGILVASIVQFGLKRKKDTWKNITEDLNSFVTFARQEAISKGQIHQLLFLTDTSGQGSIKILREGDNSERPGKKLYQEIKSPYLESVYKFPETVFLYKVFINNKVPEDADFKKGIASYIVSDGMMQDISLQVSRKSDRGTFVLNPFMGEFEFKEGYVKP